MALRIDIGGRVRSARLAAGMTQAELARAAGIHVRTVMDIESNRARNQTLDTLLSLQSVLPELHIVDLRPLCKVCGGSGHVEM